jgi:effector-binding domain-containing protein
MKIIKYLLLLLVVIVVGGALYVMIQPDAYDVKSSKTIKAPANVIFNNVNDYKNWADWGPWLEEDPSIVQTYADQTMGVGGAYSWTSKDGPGNMKTVALEEYKSIDQKIQFSDYEPSDIYWTFEETEEGTVVTWGMKADETPFMFKFAAAMSGGMDKMLGPMLTKGLDNLNVVIDEKMKNNPPKPEATYSLGGIMDIKQEAQQFIGYKHTSKIDHEAMTALFMESMPKAGMHAAAQKLDDADYTPGAVFTKWDEDNGEAEFYIGLVVKKDIPIAEGMEKITLPEGRNVMIAKYGPYGTGDEQAHTAIDMYLLENGLEQNGAIWELYVNDPEDVNPEDIETEIHYPVK